jgi:hypothetical protein
MMLLVSVKNASKQWVYAIGKREKRTIWQRLPVQINPSLQWLPDLQRRVVKLGCVWGIESFVWNQKTLFRR